MLRDATGVDIDGERCNDGIKGQLVETVANDGIVRWVKGGKPYLCWKIPTGRSGRSEGIVFKFYPKDLKDIQSYILTQVSKFGLLVFIYLC